MKRLYVWRVELPADVGTPRPWLVTSVRWGERGPNKYLRRFATHAEAIGHAQAVALERVPVAVEVTC